MSQGKGAQHQLHTGEKAMAGMPLKFLLDAFWVQWRVVLLPWQALIFGVSCCTGLCIKFLTAAGVPPVTYRDKLKLKETQKIIEHLHQREDGFRRRVKDMQARVEAKDQECRRLESKLAKALKELGANPIKRADSAQELALRQPAPGKSRLAMHFFFLLAGVLPVWWLVHQPDTPSICRKFAWSIIMPEALVYVFTLLGAGPRVAHTIIQCCSLFLSGFVFCHWLDAQC